MYIVQNHLWWVHRFAMVGIGVENVTCSSSKNMYYKSQHVWDILDEVDDFTPKELIENTSN